MNLPVLVGVIIGALVIIVFLFIQNKKDKKKLVDKLNNDYRKTKDEENDVNDEEVVK